MNIVEYIILGLRHRRDPFFVKYLSGRDVLDVGAGEGYFVAKDPRFTGIELDPNLVNSGQKKGLNIQLMSAFKMDFPDNSFDVVHASQIIEHFSPENAALFLQEASRVLKLGGIIYITTPGIRNVWNTFSHIRPYPPASFRKLLARSTEGYLYTEPLKLTLEGFWGKRAYFRRPFFNFAFGALDIVFTPHNPIGWLIILRKTA